MPVVFISHGAPDASLNAPDAMACWRRIAQHLPAPHAILAVSAHWQARQPTASLSGAPETIHDFAGFAPQLHRMQYPAPGAPALAERAVALLNQSGIAAELHPTRGLDHGGWVPLSVLYPHANVPVTQLSLILNGSAAQHLVMGQSLAPLRNEGVLILTTGAITHNFGWLDWHAHAAAEAPEARAFADWVGEQIAAGNVPALIGYRDTALGMAAHPSEEHLSPLFVGLGAAEGDAAQRYQPRFAYGGLAMDAYVWRHAAVSTQGRAWVE